MKISTLINTLINIKTKYGDIETCIMYDSGTGIRDIESIVITEDSICYINDIDKSYIPKCFDKEEINSMKEIFIK